MCEAKIVTFDGGAVFIAAKGVDEHDTKLFNIGRKLTIGLPSVPSEDGYYFGQITDSGIQPTLLRLIQGEQLPVVEQTPEELLEAGFSAEAIKRGLEAARPLAPITV